MQQKVLGQMLVSWIACAALQQPSRASAAGDCKPNQIAQGEKSAPAAVMGCWDLVIETPFFLPNQKGKLMFRLEGNTLRGTAELRGDRFRIVQGSVHGSSLRFKIEREGVQAELQGIYQSDRLSGTIRRSGRELYWKATRCKEAQ